MQRRSLENAENSCQKRVNSTKSNGHHPRLDSSVVVQINMVYECASMTRRKRDDEGRNSDETSEQSEPLVTRKLGKNLSDSRRASNPSKRSRRKLSLARLDARRSALAASATCIHPVAARGRLGRKPSPLVNKLSSSGASFPCYSCLPNLRLGLGRISL